ncbi:hypothetical protein JCM17961_31360 [Endothiovibrio diazotrophicus]
MGMELGICHTVARNRGPLGPDPGNPESTPFNLKGTTPVQGTHTNDNKRFSILFVDDESKNLKYFDRFFGKDFRVITTDNPLEAEQIIDREGEELAVLVTDQRMPGKLGTDLLRYARERSPRTVRILTSGYTDFDAVVKAINEGETFRYITKPWNRDSLGEELHRGIALFRSRGEEQALLEQRRTAMLSLAGNIAHELRTNLLGINAAVSHIAHVVPTLLDAYEIALDQTGDTAPPEVPSRDWGRRNLSFTVESIHAMLEQANMAIDLLLANGRQGEIDPQSFTSLSAHNCIKEALERYPLHPSQRERLGPVVGEDFYFSGVRLLFDFVVFNLLKNALYAIAAANKGVISIFLEPGDEVHRIRFRDTGCGIPPEVLPRIFDEYYSHRSTKEANGMGLPFCRRTLQGFGGSIECESLEGEFTEFVITLPRLKN